MSDSDTFEPCNELEQRMLDVQNGVISADEFMSYLLDTQLFMPVAPAVTDDGVLSENLAQPLVLETGEGMEVMILFSSPDRSHDFVSDFPDYNEGGILIEFHEILEKIVPGCGISINPDLDNGIDLDPDMIQQLVNEQAKKGRFNVEITPPASE